MAQELDEESNRWNYTDKIIYKYDNKNNPSQYTYYSNEGNSLWEGLIREEYSYDAMGNLTHFESFTQSEISHGWNLVGLTEHNYDNNGNLVLITISELNTIDSTWVPAKKSEFTYDGSGNLTLQIDYVRNEAGTYWINDDRSEYTYDENGNQTLYVDYYWDEEANRWVNSWRQESTYNEDGKLSQVIGYLWDDYLNVWDPFDKSVYNFDDNGNIVLENYYGVDSQTELWEEEYRFEYTYDSYGNMIEHIMYSSGLEENEWNPSGKDTYQFDFDFSYSDLILAGVYAEFLTIFPNMLVKVRNYDWDEDDNQWFEESNIRFYYSDAVYVGINTPSRQRTRIYPNPADNFINIDLDDIPKNGLFVLYDMQGRKISTDKISGNHSQVPVNHLDSGVYFYKVFHGGKTMRGKILIR